MIHRISESGIYSASSVAMFPEADDHKLEREHAITTFLDRQWPGPDCDCSRRLGRPTKPVVCMGERHVFTRTRRCGSRLLRSHSAVRRPSGKSATRCSHSLWPCWGRPSRGIDIGSTRGTDLYRNPLREPVFWNGGVNRRLGGITLLRNTSSHESGLRRDQLTSQSPGKGDRYRAPERAHPGSRVCERLRSYYFERRSGRISL